MNAFKRRDIKKCITSNLMDELLSLLDGERDINFEYILDYAIFYCSIKENVEIFKLLIEKYGHEILIYSNAINWAVIHNNLEIIKLIYKYSVLYKFHPGWSSLTCAYAAKYDNLDCLIYLHENGCIWDLMTTEWASLKGNSSCLTYAHRNGCILTDIGYKYSLAIKKPNCKWIYEEANPKRYGKQSLSPRPKSSRARIQSNSKKSKNNNNLTNNCSNIQSNNNKQQSHNNKVKPLNFKLINIPKQIKKKSRTSRILLKPKDSKI